MKSIRPTWKAVLIPFIAASFIFSPISSLAAKNSLNGSVTVGAGAVDLDGDSFKHGGYDGLYEDGTYFIGEASLNYSHDDYDIDFEAQDTGFESRSFNIRARQTGSYSLSLEYDEALHLISEGNRSPYNGSGGNNLTLPAGFGQYTTTGTMPLGANMRSLNLEQKRRSGQIRYLKKISKNLNLNVSFKREKREGIKSKGGSVGTDASSSAVAILPEPVNYVSDEFRGAVDYKRENLQAVMEIYLSQFNNDNLFLDWENPFVETIGSSYPSTARLSLPPDNRHQRLSFSGGVSLPKSSRLSFVTEYGKMEQNNTLLDYSVNGEAPPDNSANAEVETTFLKINASSRPLPEFAISAGISHYKSDNKTPRNNYRLVINDTGSQAAIDSKSDLYNLPQDYIKNESNLNLLFKVAEETSIKVGWNYKFKASGFRAVKKNKENSHYFRVNSNLSSFLTGGIKYLSSKRRALWKGEYDQSLVFESYHSPGYVSSIIDPALRYDNHPDMRQYDIADYDRSMYDINLLFSGPIDSSLSLNLGNNDLDYVDSIFGLKERIDKNYTADLTISPLKFLSLNAYYAREEQESTIAGESLSSGRWESELVDTTNTTGLGATIRLWRNRLIIAGGYTFSTSTDSVSFASGGGNDLPDIESKITVFDINARYKVGKRISISLGYQYEKFTSTDWATDGLAPDTIDNVLSMGGDLSDYEVNIARLLATYEM